MAHYDDPSPCDYFPAGLLKGPLLAVGWLEREYPYASGDPGPEVYDRLRELTRLTWQPVFTLGGHERIPGHGVVYVAPEGILHYISCHDYLPPSEFCAAVLASPSVGSPEYFKALRASGFPADDRGLSESIRRSGTHSIVEARGRALVEAIEVFRKICGRWPRALDEAIALVDDAGTWRYSPEEREFTLATDWRVREDFSLRYESGLGIWNFSTGNGAG